MFAQKLMVLARDEALEGSTTRFTVAWTICVIGDDALMHSEIDTATMMGVETVYGYADADDVGNSYDDAFEIQVVLPYLQNADMRCIDWLWQCSHALEETPAIQAIAEVVFDEQFGQYSEQFAMRFAHDMDGVLYDDAHGDVVNSCYVEDIPHGDVSRIVDDDNGFDGDGLLYPRVLTEDETMFVLYMEPQISVVLPYASDELFCDADGSSIDERVGICCAVVVSRNNAWIDFYVQTRCAQTITIETYDAIRDMSLLCDATTALNSYEIMTSSPDGRSVLCYELNVLQLMQHIDDDSLIIAHFHADIECHRLLRTSLRVRFFFMMAC